MSNNFKVNGPRVQQL